MRKFFFVLILLTTGLCIAQNKEKQIRYQLSKSSRTEDQINLNNELAYLLRLDSSSIAEKLVAKNYKDIGKQKNTNEYIHTLYTHGRIAYRNDYYDSAYQLYTKSLDIANKYKLERYKIKPISGILLYLNYTNKFEEMLPYLGLIEKIKVHKNDSEFYAHSLMSKMMYEYQISGNLNYCTHLAMNAAHIFLRNGYTSEYLNCLTNASTFLDIQGKTKESLDLLFLARSKSNEQDTATHRYILITIGNTCLQLKDFKIAEKNFKEGLRLATATDGYQSAFRAANGLAVCFRNQFQNKDDELSTDKENLKRYAFLLDSAFKYSNLSIEYAKLNDNIYGVGLSKYVLANTIINYSKLYSTELGHYKNLDAVSIAKESLNELGPPKASNIIYLCKNYEVLASCLILRKQYKEAIIFANTGLILINEYPTQAHKLLNSKYNLLREVSKAYAKIGNYSEASKYFSQFESIVDSVFSANKAVALADATTKYETEKKDAENKLLMAENAKQAAVAKSATLKKRGWTAAAIGALLVAIFSGLWFNQKRKATEQNLLLEKQHFAQQIEQQENKNLQAILDALETERTRIAQDLHDRIGAGISTAKLYFEGMKELVSKGNDQLTKNFEHVDELLNTSIGEVRKVSQNMLSGVLADFGLVPALQELQATIQNSGTLTLSLSTNLDTRLDKQIEINLYRIIQELISNTIKHARASTITLSLMQENDQIVVAYSDNGTGFNPSENQRGMGLKNIEARLLAIGGTLQNNSSQGKGSAYDITI